MLTSSRSDLSIKWLSVGVALMTIYTYWNYSSDNFDAESLRGKRVLVTGASAGIGEQIAYHYARAGAKLLLTARTESKLQLVVDRCRIVGSNHEDYFYIPADMANMTSTQLVIEEAIERLGGLDILVLNHILPHNMGEWMGTGSNLTLIDTLFDVNFRAYVYLASHALEHLERSGGSIVVVSSIAGRVPQPYVTAYSSTKFALDGFFSGLRQELLIRDSSISVTMCIIGLTETATAMAEMNRFNLQFILQSIKAADPADTAMAIIRGGATRQREVYFPYMVAKTTMLRDLFPETFAYLNRYMYRRSET